MTKIKFPTNFLIKLAEKILLGKVVKYANYNANILGDK